MYANSAAAAQSQRVRLFASVSPLSLVLASCLLAAQAPLAVDIDGATTVTNFQGGRISATGQAINAITSDALINNEGTIETSFTGTSAPSGAAPVINNRLGEIRNSGIIEGEGGVVIETGTLRGVADENFTGMLRAHGDVALRVTAALRTTPNNDGTIHGRDGGILSIGNEEIVNHADGVIQGDAIDSSVGIEFFGISGTRDSSSITNMGLIRGDTAIRAGSFFQVDLSMIN